jgi:outer membrane immunogenic protein
MKKTLFAGVSLFAFVSTAGAADLPRRMPAQEFVQAFSWTGFYVGGHTGVAVSKTKINNNAPFNGFDAGGVPLSYELNPVNIFGGGQFGYNWQYGVYVFGLESDVGYLGVRGNAYTGTDDYVAVKYGWYGTATGRLGLAYDRLLSYVKGGAAVASITNTASHVNAPGVFDPTDYSQVTKTRLGWTVGTGFELAFAPSWSLKSEYMYMDFGKQTSRNIDGDSFTHKNQIHTWKVGLNYRWGGNAPIVARY